MLAFVRVDSPIWRPPGGASRPRPTPAHRSSPDGSARCPAKPNRSPRRSTAPTPGPASVTPCKEPDNACGRAQREGRTHPRLRAPLEATVHRLQAQRTCPADPPQIPDRVSRHVPLGQRLRRAARAARHVFRIDTLPPRSASSEPIPVPASGGGGFRFRRVPGALGPPLDGARSRAYATGNDPPARGGGHHAQAVMRRIAGVHRRPVHYAIAMAGSAASAEATARAIASNQRRLHAAAPAGPGRTRYSSISLAPTAWPATTSGCGRRGSCSRAATSSGLPTTPRRGRR